MERAYLDPRNPRTNRVPVTLAMCTCGWRSGPYPDRDKAKSAAVAHTSRSADHLVYRAEQRAER